MKIVAINTVDYGSTGRIMTETAGYAREAGHQCYTFSIARNKKHEPVYGHQYYMSYFGYMLHYMLGKVTGANGFFSVIPTIRLISRIRRIDPDIVHIHNIHGFSINIPILLFGLKRLRAGKVWTLHDCWTFTGHCAHYDMIGCLKWQNGCSRCPVYRQYPESDFDNSRWMWKYKKRNFNSIQNIVFVTPSEWMKTQFLKSFLQKFPVHTIHNGIDLSVFKPSDSDFRGRYGLEEKHIVLGVAFDWGETKGLDVFRKLAEKLPDDYAIVLAGTSDRTDALLGPGIISIHKTANQQELAEIYSAADVFVNPTRQDTFPTVNIEALACGTPVITCRTGGSTEIIDPSGGAVVEKDDVDALGKEIVRACDQRPFSADDCVKRAQEFSKQKSYSEYLRLYGIILADHHS